MPPSHQKIPKRSQGPTAAFQKITSPLARSRSTLGSGTHPSPPGSLSHHGGPEDPQASRLCACAASEVLTLSGPPPGSPSCCCVCRLCDPSASSVWSTSSSSSSSGTRPSIPSSWRCWKPHCRSPEPYQPQPPHWGEPWAGACGPRPAHVPSPPTRPLPVPTM